MKIESPQFNIELVKRFFHIASHRPNRAQVEITNRCNLNCPMCPRNDYNLPHKDMDFPFFKKIMEKLKDVELILPVGWGESFIHPDIDKIIDYLAGHNHKIKITTNGLLLDNEKLRAAAMKIDYLSFSFEFKSGSGNDHGHSNDKITQNIKALIAGRGQKHKPYICLQTVLLRENQEVPTVIKLAKQIGADRVNIVRPYLKFDRNLGLSWPERKKVYRDAENLGRKIGLRVDMFEYASFSGIKRYCWKHFKSLFRVNQWCPRLYDFVYVTLDGRVTPCCALPRYIVGDLAKETIGEIWQGKKMNEFRNNHIAVCKECDVFKIG